MEALEKTQQQAEDLQASQHQCSELDSQLESLHAEYNQLQDVHTKTGTTDRHVLCRLCTLQLPSCTALHN